MKKSEMKVWKKRWNALEVRMKSLATAMRNSDIKESQALQTTTEALLKFGAKQFFFFYNGFSDCIKGNDYAVFDSEQAIDMRKVAEEFRRLGYPAIRKFNDTPLTYMAKLKILDTDKDEKTAGFSKLSPAFQLYVNEIYQTNKDRDFSFVRPKATNRRLQRHIRQLHTTLQNDSSEHSRQSFHTLLQEYRASGLISEEDATPTGHSQALAASPTEIYKHVCEALADTDLDSDALRQTLEEALGQLSPVPSSEITLDHIKLECSDILPAEYVLRSVLDQIAIDIGVLEQIFYQRQQLQGSDILRTLTKSDALAMQILDVARDNGLFAEEAAKGDKIAAITYFDLGASIRVVPYANIALIAVPYTAINNIRDLLAIPHEVAHQVFWKGVVTDRRSGAPKRLIGELGKLFRNSDTYPDYLRGWVEEVFADVFAENMTHSVNQQMLNDIHTHHAPKELDLDDGTYPPALIRSQILDSLWKTEAELQNEDTDLKGHFADSKFLTAKQRELTGDQTPDSQRTLVRDAAKNLRKIAREIDQKILRGLPSILKHSANVGTRVGESHSILFRALLAELEVPQVYPEVRVTQFSWHDVVVEIQRELASRSDGALKSVPIALWLPVFESDGWTKEGPGGVIHPG